MKKSAKPLAKNFKGRKPDGGSRLDPPAYGVDFVDRETEALESPDESAIESSPDRYVSDIPNAPISAHNTSNSRQGNAVPTISLGDSAPVQLEEDPGAEEVLQGEFGPAPARDDPEDEETVQGKFAPVQLQNDLEKDELLQGKFAENAAPVKFDTDPVASENRTGLPDRLKLGLEQLGGLDLSGVRVHYNSSKPAQVKALAFTQGQEIHIGPGQEKHLPHEGWHAVQQMQGRVKPTIQTKGLPVNDETGLEHEADVMGAKSLQVVRAGQDSGNGNVPASTRDSRQILSSRIQNKSVEPPSYAVQQRHTALASLPPFAQLQNGANPNRNKDCSNTLTKSEPLVIQRQDSSREPPVVSPEVAGLNSRLYVDLFESVVYDLEYRGQNGSLSAWLKVNYADGTSIDISIYDIIEESVDPRTAVQMMANGTVGAGGRIYPESMNPRTTPRLYAAKQEAIRIMEEFNFQFMLGTLPAVIFILTLGIGGIGGTGGASRVTRTTARRPPTGGPPPAPAPSPPPAAPAPRPAPRGGGGPSSGVPTTGTPGSPGASVRAAEARAASSAPVATLTAAQRTMRDSLMREHPTLHTRVASDAVSGAERVAGAGGRGADVILLNGGGREISVHRGAFTPEGVGAHLLEEASQVGTTEIYLQINTGTREGFLRMLPGIRSGYAELQGVFVKIFGPDGQVWWNGFFRGLR